MKVRMICICILGLSGCQIHLHYHARESNDGQIVEVAEREQDLSRLPSSRPARDFVELWGY